MINWATRWLPVRLVCAAWGHPPSTWGNEKMENAVIDALITLTDHPPAFTPPGGTSPMSASVTVEVGCVCGHKIVPFRVRPRRKDEGPE